MCPSRCAGEGLKFSLVPQLCDVAEGLNYLHSCNVVHGNMKGVRVFRPPGDLTNIKQENIVVDHSGRGRITDFALAESSYNKRSKMHDQNARWTAPEVLQEMSPLTKEADVFSFGMVMAEVRRRHRPYRNLWLTGQSF